MKAFVWKIATDLSFEVIQEAHGDEVVRVCFYVSFYGLDDMGSIVFRKSCTILQQSTKRRKL
jgi:hypothetical protein